MMPLTLLTAVVTATPFASLVPMCSSTSSAGVAVIQLAMLLRINAVVSPL